jgi:hypothetical protein
MYELGGTVIYMGRLSIYLPDELEARTKALEPSTSTSQVVRTALERYLGTRGTAPYADPPEDVSDLMAAAVAHFAEQARLDYQDGYRAALRRLPDLDWHTITGLARDSFDLHKWLTGWTNGIASATRQGESLDAATPSWLPRVADDLGNIADPTGFDQWSFRRSLPYERGYSDGLRAGYEAALGAGVLTGTGEPPTNSAAPKK